MPISGKNITKVITLPNYPADDPAVLEIIVNPKASIMDDIDTSTDPKLAERQMLSKIIVKWNFVDAEGKETPITPDTIKDTLSIFDLDVIHTELGFSSTLTKEQKKS